MAPKLSPYICDIVKKLAGQSNDERAESVDKLIEFFKQRPIPSEVTTYKNMMIIWRGLYFAMLHQAEPLKQEDLADKISNMIQGFTKQKNFLLFVRCAMDTFEQEWYNRSTFIVNKMLMFFRRIIRQSFFRLADKKWQNCDKFMQMLEEVIIRPTDDDHKFKVQPKMHLSSLFMEELAKAHNEHFTHKILMVFLQPYIKVITASRDARYVADVHGNVFQHLIRQSDVGVDSRADLQENEVLVDKESGKLVNPANRRPTLQGSDGEDDDDEWEDEEIDGEDEWEDEETDGEEEDGEIDDEEMDEEDEEIDDEEEELDDEEEELDDEDEELDGEDEEMDDEEEEYPLDPRAGNVDVILPQIEVDYENLVKVLCSIMESDSTQMRFRNLKKLRILIRQLQDVVGNVYPLSQHPTVHPVHTMMEEDVAEVDLDKAVSKRLELHEKEFKADPKFRKAQDKLTMEMLEELYAKSSKIKNMMQRERAQKWIALNLKKKQYDKRKEELKFQKYAKRTVKLNAKVDNRRLKAQGLLLSTDEKEKKLKQKTEDKRQALFNHIDDVIQTASSATNTSDAPSSATSNTSEATETTNVVTSDTNTKTTKTVSNGTTSKTMKAVSNGTTSKATKAVSNGTTSKATKAVSNGTTSKATKAVSNDTTSKATKAVSNHTTSKATKAVSSNSDSETNKAVSSANKEPRKKSLKGPSKKIVAVDESEEPMAVNTVQGLLNELLKRERSMDESSVRIAKKRKMMTESENIRSLLTPPSKKAKKKPTTPTSIKINLGQNTQHEFNDYRRSILASPGLPFQPDRTPLSSVLKATSSPILVKKPFSKTLRSIPTNAKFESPSPTLNQKKGPNSKKGKVSPHVLKGLQKKGLSLEGLAAKPVAKKHSHNRASAADFF